VKLNECPGGVASEREKRKSGNKKLNLKECHESAVIRGRKKKGWNFSNID